MAKPRIAIIVGSNRRDSINRKLARALAKLGSDKFDASFARIDDLPMFNQDLEGNLPEEAVRFKSELAKADGVLIVTPEHDRSIPALLKNAVDWGARPYGKNSWTGKPGFVTGTSPLRDRQRARATASALCHGRARDDPAGRRGLRHVQAEPRRRGWQHR
jgi:chromate reductase, NAD(P)H dehydrogenase (quinone)